LSFNVYAFALMPIGFVLAIILTALLTETYCKSQA